MEEETMEEPDTTTNFRKCQDGRWCAERDGVCGYGETTASALAALHEAMKCSKPA